MLKKASTILFITILSFSSKAEIWFDVGVKAGITTGAFINSNLLGANTQALKFKPGYLLGGKIGINFGIKHSLTVDFITANTSIGMHNSVTDLTNTVSITTFDLPIMYRVNQDNGGYGEIGPQFSFTTSGSSTIEGVTTDDKAIFNGTNMAIAAGFGQYIGGGNTFGFTFGFRFAYTLGDIVSSDFASSGSDPVYKPHSQEEIADYSYSGTSRLYAGVVLEANFNLGYIAKGAKCTKKTKFRLF